MSAFVNQRKHVSDCWNSIVLDTDDYVAQKNLLTDKFWEWLSDIEDNYGIPTGAKLHIKWTCEVEENTDNVNTALYSDALADTLVDSDLLSAEQEAAKLKEEYDELMRQKKLLEEGKLFDISESLRKLDESDNIESTFGPETTRLLGVATKYNSLTDLPSQINLLMEENSEKDNDIVVSETERIAQLDEALAAAADLFKELGLNMGDLDINENFSTETALEQEDFGKKEWPPKPKKKQWPPKPTSRASVQSLITTSTTATPPKRKNNFPSANPVPKKILNEDSPWICYACNTENTKGKFCHLCSIEKLPPGYPSPPFQKKIPTKFDGKDPGAYKEWMRQKAKYEVWENSLLLYRTKFKEGNGQECLKIIQRLKEDLSEDLKASTSTPTSSRKSALSSSAPLTKSWACYQCGTENSRGSKCSKCKEEKIPEGFPLPPPKPVGEPPLEREAKKEYMQRKTLYDIWSIALQNYRENEGNKQSCKQIIDRLNFDLNHEPPKVPSFPKTISAGAIDRIPREKIKIKIKGDGEKREKTKLKLDLSKINGDEATTTATQQLQEIMITESENPDGLVGKVKKQSTSKRNSLLDEKKKLRKREKSSSVTKDDKLKSGLNKERKHENLRKSDNEGSPKRSPQKRSPVVPIRHDLTNLPNTINEQPEESNRESHRDKELGDSRKSRVRRAKSAGHLKSQKIQKPV